MHFYVGYECAPIQALLATACEQNGDIEGMTHPHPWFEYIPAAALASSLSSCWRPPLLSASFPWLLAGAWWVWSPVHGLCWYRCYMNMRIQEPMDWSSLVNTCQRNKTHNKQDTQQKQEKDVLLLEPAHGAQGHSYIQMSLESAKLCHIYTYIYTFPFFPRSLLWLGAELGAGKGARKGAANPMETPTARGAVLGPTPSGQSQI